MKYFLLIFLLVAVSCAEFEVEENPLLFFWEEMDKKYVFFEQKNVDWDSIKVEILKYDPNKNEELIAGFENMIYPLKDKHTSILTDETNISLPFRYFNWIKIDLAKYSVSKIFETDLLTVVQLNDNIVYIEIKSFEEFIPDFYRTIKGFNYKKGIIIDIRNNTGGLLMSAFDIASNFIQGKHIVLYRKYKNGYGHNDFTDYKPEMLEGTDMFPDIKKVMLIDKNTYSGANMFASVMKNFTNITLVGNITGGGGASLTEGILPNGWVYSISQDPVFDNSFKSLELGVEPHYWVIFDEIEFHQYIEKGVHPQMEFAYNILLDDK